MSSASSTPSTSATPVPEKSTTTNVEVERGFVRGAAASKHASTAALRLEPSAYSHAHSTSAFERAAPEIVELQAYDEREQHRVEHDKQRGSRSDVQARRLPQHRMVVRRRRARAPRRRRPLHLRLRRRRPPRCARRASATHRRGRGAGRRGAARHASATYISRQTTRMPSTDLGRKKAIQQPPRARHRTRAPTHAGYSAACRRPGRRPQSRTRVAGGGRRRTSVCACASRVSNRRTRRAARPRTRRR